MAPKAKARGDRGGGHGGVAGAKRKVKSGSAKETTPLKKQDKKSEEKTKSERKAGRARKHHQRWYSAGWDEKFFEEQIGPLVRG